MTRRDLTLAELYRLRDHLRRRKLEPEDWALLPIVLELVHEPIDAEEDRGSDCTLGETFGSTLSKLDR